MSGWVDPIRPAATAVTEAPSAMSSGSEVYSGYDVGAAPVSRASKRTAPTGSGA